METERPLLTASWDEAAMGAWRGAACVHLEAAGVGAAGLAELVGERLCQELPAPPGRARLRVEPHVSLATFAAVLRAAGWSVEEVVRGRLLTAAGPLPGSGDGLEGP